MLWGRLSPPAPSCASIHHFQSNQSVFNRSTSDFTFRLTTAFAFCRSLCCFFFATFPIERWASFFRDPKREDDDVEGPGSEVGCRFAFGGSRGFAWDFFPDCRDPRGASFYHLFEKGGDRRFGQILVGVRNPPTPATAGPVIPGCRTRLVQLLTWRDKGLAKATLIPGGRLEFNKTSSSAANVAALFNRLPSIRRCLYGSCNSRKRWGG